MPFRFHKRRAEIAILAILISISLVGFIRLKKSGTTPERKAELVDFRSGVVGSRFVFPENRGDNAREDLLDSTTLRALAKIHDARYSEAIEILNGYAVTQPSNSEVLINLSAAYLARYASKRSPIDLAHGYAVADRALAIDSSSREAAFNRAVALTELALAQPALNAWGRYLKADPDSIWSDFGRHQVGVLTSYLRSSKDSDARNFKLGLDDRSFMLIEKFATGHRRAARVLVQEELLEKWASASSDGNSDSGGEALSIASGILDTLSRKVPDRQLAGAVLEIKSLGDYPSGKRVRLAEGYILYKRGRDAYARADYRAAYELLGRSVVAFKDVRSVFWLRAYFSLGCSLYFQARRDESFRVFTEVDGLARAHGYQALEAEVLWMKGLSQFARGNLGASGESYQTALSIFKAIGEPDSAAGIHFLLVESLDYQGAYDQAWVHCLEALRQAALSSDPLRRYQIYSVTATSSLHIGIPGLALVLQNLAVSNARLLGNSSALAAALTWRARYLIQLGRPDEASNDISEARKVVVAIPSAAARSRASGDLLIADSLSPGRSPRQVVDSLIDAESKSLSAGARYQQIEMLLNRAKAYRLLGDAEASQRDLEDCVRLIETRRGAILADSVKISFLDRERVVYDSLVSLLITRQQPAKALDYMERGRARVLLDLIHRSSPASGRDGLKPSSRAPLTTDQIFKSIPHRVSILYYGVIGEDLFAWLLIPGRPVTMVRIGSRQELLQDVSRFDAGLLERSLSRPSNVKDGALYSKLVGCLLKFVPRDSLVVIVPDDFLGNFPFAALWNPVSGKFLVEEFELLYAASASSYLGDLALARLHTKDRARSVLAIGDPTVDWSQLTNLPSLPRAAEEAERIAALYPISYLLRRETATKRNFSRYINNVDVVHFAGHLLPDFDDPLSSVLVMGVAGESPGSGSLSAREVYSMKLRRTRLVVLSACRGSNGVSSVSEGPMSFVRAFLAAGAPAVVGALWGIDDKVALQVSQSFHKRASHGEGFASSLRKAQLECLMDRFGRDRSHSDCFAFSIWGGADS